MTLTRLQRTESLKEQIADLYRQIEVKRKELDEIRKQWCPSPSEPPLTNDGEPDPTIPRRRL